VPALLDEPPVLELPPLLVEPPVLELPPTLSEPPLPVLPAAPLELHCALHELSMQFTSAIASF